MSVQGRTQFFAAFLEQRVEAGAIAACIVMESGCDLDQAVQERFSFSARV